MTDRARQDGVDESRRRRYRRQAIALAAIAVAIYVGYLAFMIYKGTGGA